MLRNSDGTLFTSGELRAGPVGGIENQQRLPCDESPAIWQDETVPSLIQNRAIIAIKLAMNCA
jgi:hypothetical protein